MGDEQDTPPAEAPAVPEAEPAPAQALEPDDPGPISTEPQFRGERPEDAGHRMAPEPADPGLIHRKEEVEGERGGNDG